MYRHISLDIDPYCTSSVEGCIQQFFKPSELEIKCELCTCERALESREFVKLWVFFHRPFFIFSLIKTHSTVFELTSSSTRPNALLLHFKRFVVDLAPNFRLRYNKINERVEFKEDIDLYPYYSANDPDKNPGNDPEIGYDCSGFMFANPFAYNDPINPLKVNVEKNTGYKLKSIIHHLGRTASRGHYTADVLTRNNCSEVWMRCSDSVVTPCTEIEDTILGQKSQKEAYMVLYERDIFWFFHK